MTPLRLERCFALLLATAGVGALVACGDCPDPDDVVFPVLPAANGDRTGLDELGVAIDLTCATDCADAAGCEPITIALDDGTELPAVSCSYFAECGAGRRPLAPTPPPPLQPSVGAWLHHTARLEADSVGAFRQVARDLRRFGAPRRLVRAARRSARDEVRHTRIVSALARRHGAPRVFVLPTPPHHASDLVELAVHNAVEGCVRETYAALVAHVQAQRACDPQVRAAFRRIARDETRHAALSFAIDRWAHHRLPAGAHARVGRARRHAVVALAREAARPIPDQWATTLGLPHGPMAARLAEGLFAPGSPASVA